jgi:hypothetical protein
MLNGHVGDKQQTTLSDSSYFYGTFSCAAPAAYDFIPRKIVACAMKNANPEVRHAIARQKVGPPPQERDDGPEKHIC